MNFLIACGFALAAVGLYGAFVLFEAMPLTPINHTAFLKKAIPLFVIVLITALIIL